MPVVRVRFSDRMQSSVSQRAPLGIEGFSYADLHVPQRLKALHDVFCREVAAADPAFWAEWSAYAADPDAPRSPIVVSDLIVRMAPHVSRFVMRLFDLGDAARVLADGTRSLDEVFR